MSFTESLTSPQQRPQVVAALTRAIDEEVASKGGLFGVVVKGAYATVKGVSPTAVRDAMNAMLPDLAATLEPYWTGRGTTPFPDHLRAHRKEAADRVLAVADTYIGRVDNTALVRVYHGLRGRGEDLVADALPRMGRAIEPYVS